MRVRPAVDPISEMTAILDRYLSFNGRLARVPYFSRSVYLGIAASVLFVASIVLFSSGRSSVVDRFVMRHRVPRTACSWQRLSDRAPPARLSGYHAIWVAAAQVVLKASSYGPLKVLLFGLPLAAIGLWLVFWPGNAQTNRFGEAPN